ncbi:type I-E CRISPR-associated protein Cse1/CasA [Arcanobacterium phocae]|uniref:type I-E CRISPR-associated protein Cse1/CasA n=1 Tax=Arcanobacterium phocae TaxID=131112 RepID=UPI001C11BE4A|nr:type I-E CRISPR-associated protein Cse1/CasA [Arcanobacterium phocae]
MDINALTDINWVSTTQGDISVRDALLRLHEPEFMLDMQKPAFEVAATFRFLLSVVPVVLRYEEESEWGNVNDMVALATSGFSVSAVDRSLESLSKSATLFDAAHSFMQRPVLAPKSAKDTSRKIGPGDQEVKKLSPAMPSDRGEDYWNLIVSFPVKLSLPDAVLKLVTYHYYSMAGNNKYDGDKTRMGAPGIRFLGKGNAATEFIWDVEGESFLYSLLASLPKSWVDGQGLPAWADREMAISKMSNGLLHPLWMGTWSSNTAACYWEEENGQQYLTGVRVGGVPPQWLPIAYVGKESEKALKEWWDIRNENDPMYLYMADSKNSDGAKKAQRIDFGRDGTDLAIEWAAEDKLDALLNSGNANILPSDAEERKPIFFRHQIEGTASSPSVRASDVFFADPDVWGFGLRSQQRNEVRWSAQLIRNTHRSVTSVFRRRNASDAKREASGYPALALDALENSRADASAEFWRQITPFYEEYMSELRAGAQPTQKLSAGIYRAAMQTYDQITEPFIGQFSQQIFAVRASLSRIIQKNINEHYSPTKED